MGREVGVGVGGCGVEGLGRAGGGGVAGLGEGGDCSEPRGRGGASICCGEAGNIEGG